MACKMDGSQIEAAGTFVGFSGATRVAEGPLAVVADALRRCRAQDAASYLLAFDRQTGQVVDLDLRGSEAEVLARYAPPPEPPAQRGRPKLGVVAREVTLLPRHWDWLSAQPGGASVTLRRLVEIARKGEAETGDARRRAEATYRFMVAMAGDFPGFEAAARALFAGDHEGVVRQVALWPADLRDEILGNWLGRQSEVQEAP